MGDKALKTAPRVVLGEGMGAGAGRTALGN